MQVIKSTVELQSIYSRKDYNEPKKTHTLCLVKLTTNHKILLIASQKEMLEIYKQRFEEGTGLDTSEILNILVQNYLTNEVTNEEVRVQWNKLQRFKGLLLSQEEMNKFLATSVCKEILGYTAEEVADFKNGFTEGTLASADVGTVTERQWLVMKKELLEYFDENIWGSLYLTSEDEPEMVINVGFKLVYNDPDKGYCAVTAHITN